MKYLYLNLIVKRFQRFCQAQSDLKLTAQMGEIALEKKYSADYAPGSGDFIGLTLHYSLFTVMSVCSSSCDTNTFTHSLAKYIYYTWKSIISEKIF